MKGFRGGGKSGLWNEGLADKIANSSETTRNQRIQNALADNRRTFTFEKTVRRTMQCQCFYCVFVFVHLRNLFFFDIFDIAFRVDNVSKIPHKMNNMKLHANILKVKKPLFLKIKFGLHIFYFKRYISIG